MLGLSDIQNSNTTLHQDLAKQDGLIVQILAAVANGQIDQVAAQNLITSMNADDATAQTRIAALTAALTPASSSGPTAP